MGEWEGGEVDEEGRSSYNKCECEYERHSHGHAGDREEGQRVEPDTWQDGCNLLLSIVRFPERDPAIL